MTTNGGDMTDDNEYRRAQINTFDAVWEAVSSAESALHDDAGTLDPYARAVLAVVRTTLRSLSDSIEREWDHDAHVARIRASNASA
jgi:hypothetical protein